MCPTFWPWLGVVTAGFPEVPITAIPPWASPQGTAWGRCVCVTLTGSHRSRSVFASISQMWWPSATEEDPSPACLMPARPQAHTWPTQTCPADGHPGVAVPLHPVPGWPPCHDLAGAESHSGVTGP